MCAPRVARPVRGPIYLDTVCGSGCPELYGLHGFRGYFRERYASPLEKQLEQTVAPSAVIVIAADEVPAPPAPAPSA